MAFILSSFIVRMMQPRRARRARRMKKTRSELLGGIGENGRVDFYLFRDGFQRPNIRKMVQEGSAWGRSKVGVFSRAIRNTPS